LIWAQFLAANLSTPKNESLNNTSYYSQDESAFSSPNDPIFSSPNDPVFSSRNEPELELSLGKTQAEEELRGV